MIKKRLNKNSTIVIQHENTIYNLNWDSNCGNFNNYTERDRLEKKTWSLAKVWLSVSEHNKPYPLELYMDYLTTNKEQNHIELTDYKNN